MSDFKFSIKTKSVPVTLEQNDGTEITYRIHQLTGAGADALRAAQAAKLVLDSAGNVKEIKDYTGQYTELLTRCLKDGAGVLVSKETLDAWPDETLKGLYEVAADLNGMRSDASEDNPKNS